MHDQTRFRVLLIFLTVSLLANLALAYTFGRASLRLTWLETNLSETNTIYDRQNWTTVDESNRVIKDFQPITNLALPINWVFIRPSQNADYRTITLKNTVPADRQSLTWLVGGTISIPVVKQFKDSDEFMAESKKMYTDPEGDRFRKVISFVETTIDGHKGYRAEGDLTNITSFGVELTRPSRVVEYATFVNGYVISFHMVAGSYSTDKEISQFTQALDDIVKSVKLAASS